MNRLFLTMTIGLLTISSVNANSFTDYACSDYKKEIKTLHKNYNRDILTLLKGRDDIILTVQTKSEHSFLCASFYKVDKLNCDFILDTDDNIDVLKYKKSILNNKLQGE